MMSDDLPPVPGQPIAEAHAEVPTAMPAERSGAVSLDYITANVAGARRPGVLTALGVCSIVFAAMQALVGAGSILSTVVMFTMGSMASSPPATMPAGAAPSTQSIPFANPRGLEAPRRDLIVSAIAEHITLSPARRDVLRGMLAQNGKDVAPAASTLTTPAQASAIISAAIINANRDVEITFASGRMTITDDHGSFEPGDNLSVVERSFAADSPKPGEPGFDPDRDTVAEQQQQAQLAAQQAMIRNQLAAISAMSPRGSPVSSSIVLGTAALSVLLSILLAVAAIQLLRGRPDGRKLHLWWALLKIGNETLAVIASAIVMSALMNSIASATAVSTPGMSSSAASYVGYFAVVSALFQWLFSMAYPAAVLIVLNLRGVKTHFATMTIA